MKQLSKKELNVLLKSKTPLWKRIIAYLIDILIINLIIITPFKKIINQTPNIKNISQLYSFLQTSKNFIYISIIISILTLLYWTIFEYKFHQSIGKMLLNLYVKSKTKKLEVWQCFVRNVTKISLPLLALDCLYLLKTKNIRYFEKLSNTKVIEPII